MPRASRPNLKALIQENLSAAEHPPTQELINRLRGARQRGYLTRGQLDVVCRWKAPRVLNLVQSNNHHRIRAATAAAFAAPHEVMRMEALVALRGVSIPMGSAILMATSPRRYGVIDVRVWQLLYRRGFVTENPRGTKFTVGQWCTFLELLRGVARDLRVGVRTVERTLYEIDQRERPVLGVGHA